MNAVGSFQSEPSQTRPHQRLRLLESRLLQLRLFELPHGEPTLPKMLFCLGDGELAEVKDGCRQHR
jgi:hypothetical protein